MNNRVGHLFEQFGFNNGDEGEESEKWKEWIRYRHPKLVDQMINEVSTMKDVDEEEKLPEAYVAVGKALFISASQFFFDVATGVIYPDLQLFEDRIQEIPPDEALDNIKRMRKGAHKIVDQVFDQYTQEYNDLLEDRG